MESELVGNPIVKNEEERTRSKSVSVLLTSISTDESAKTLLEYAVNNRDVNYFLRFTGVIWSSDYIALTVLQYSWNIIIRLTLVLGLFYCIDGVIFLSSFDQVMFFAVFLQCCTLCFGLNEINRRLNTNVGRQYALYLTQGLKAAYLVLFVSIAIASMPMHYLNLENAIIYCSTEVVVCILLTATMYFISTDCAYASSLLDQLMEQQKMEKLTFEQYTIARKAISECQTSSTWINNAIVIVACLDIAAVLLFVFTIGFSHGTFGILLACALLLKEIPFLFVVYWQVAQVNEKSAKFMSQLAVTRWNVESNTDNERMAIFFSAQGSPICMSLAGMKLKRKDLAWQFALWCFAFAVSIVRSMLVNKA